MNTSQIVTIFSIVSLLVVFYIIYKLNKNDEILKGEIDKINNNVNDINSILLLNNKKNILNKNIDVIEKKTDVSSLKEDYDNYVKTNYDELDGLEPLSDNLKIEMDEIGGISNETVVDPVIDSEKIIENAVNDAVEHTVQNNLGEDEFDIEFEKSENNELQQVNNVGTENENENENIDEEKEDELMISIDFKNTEEKNEIDNTPPIIKMLGQENDIEKIVSDEISELSSEKKRESESELDSNETLDSNKIFGEKNLHDINNMTLKELQNIARENKLKVTGKKDILIERVKALYNLHNNMHH